MQNRALYTGFKLLMTLLMMKRLKQQPLNISEKGCVKSERLIDEKGQILFWQSAVWQKKTTFLVTNNKVAALLD